MRGANLRHNFSNGVKMRFFFDYTNKHQSLLDFHGGEFLSVSDAVDFAEATVESLKNSFNGDWTGWSVEVRSPEGTKCASLPVTLDLEA
jgi:hypothetical protein